MAEDNEPDYYEVLQISPNADPDTVHRGLYQPPGAALPSRQPNHRQMPTSSACSPRRIKSLVTPSAVPAYDVQRPTRQEERVAILSEAWKAVTDVEAETVASAHDPRVACTRGAAPSRRVPASRISISEDLVGRPREHIDFALWYLVQKKYVSRTDGSPDHNYRGWDGPPRIARHPSPACSVAHGGEIARVGLMRRTGRLGALAGI
jgi:hypothetical protein